MGVTFRMLQLLLALRGGRGWCFAHRAPASLAAHRQLFGPAVEFGHEFSGIVCNAADL